MFWHSGNNNHGSSAQNQYLLPKAPNAGSPPHAGNEWMIVERSHFTEKKKSKSQSLYLLTPTNAEGFFLSRHRDNRASNPLVHAAKNLAHVFRLTAVPEALIASVLWASLTKFRAGSAGIFLWYW